MRNNRRPAQFNLNPAARAAVKAFRDAKPWRGTEAELDAKFQDLHTALCGACSLSTKLVRDAGERTGPGSSGDSFHDGRRIVLKGRLSVVTYLWLFNLARGMNPVVAMTEARAVFAHFFPRSTARCVEVAGLLVGCAEAIDMAQADGEQADQGDAGEL